MEKFLNKVLQGDCIKVMEEMPAGCVDLILCDLPYGTTDCAWDTIIPFEQLWPAYYRLLRPNGFIVLTASQPFTTQLIASNIDRFSHQWIWKKPSGATPLLAKVMPMKNFEDVLVFSNEFQKYDTEGIHPVRPYAKELFTWLGKTKKEIFQTLGNQGVCHFMRFDSMQFTLCTRQTYQDLIEVYGIDQFRGFMTYDQMADIDREFKRETFDGKNPRIYNPQMIAGKPYKASGGGRYIEHLDYTMQGQDNKSGERYPTAIIEFGRDAESFHPTQKPVALFEYLIKTYTNPGDTVLDNCAGSGTTGVACVRTERNFILIEQETKYIDVINKRLRITSPAQQAATSSKPEQLDLFL